MISQARLREIFSYSEEGFLIWKKGRKGARFDRPAGSVKPVPFGDRRKITIDGVEYAHSILVWVFHRGLVPVDKTVDHSDKNQLNDRIENLRLGNQSQQNMNKGKQINNRSGFKGVTRTKYGWHAHIQAYGCKKRKQFKCLGMALKWRREMAFLLHGEFARH